MLPEIIKEIGKEGLVIGDKKENLIYAINWNNGPQIQEEQSRGSRGDGAPAFQTDFCVVIKETKNGKAFVNPLVVIEFKTGTSTHDVLTYSAKAGKHKRIYPYLRYGLISSRFDTVQRRFFTHNEHIDFYVAAKELLETEKNREQFAYELLTQEIKTALLLRDLYFPDKNKDSGCLNKNYYRTAITFDDLPRACHQISHIVVAAM